MRHLIWSRRPSGQNACWQRTTRCDPRFERQRAVQLLQPRAPFTARPYLRPESPHPRAPCSSPRTPVDRRQHRRRRVRRSAGEAVPPVERPPFHYWRPRLATPTYAVKRPTVATQLGLWLRIDVQDEDAATSRGVSRAHPAGLSVSSRLSWFLRCHLARPPSLKGTRAAKCVLVPSPTAIACRSSRSRPLQVFAEAVRCRRRRNACPRRCRAPPRNRRCKRNRRDRIARSSAD